MGKLTKEMVSTGLFWVEAPEAGVAVLCGCPADAVKHLMKRGLIRSVERAGARFETGPNVVLLSDTLIQNGSFCNLAEFPVLQMLYRQAMILPGHPNNTGTKPILVGRAAQVTAQLDYIHRGNYGLVSEEEIAAAGIEPCFAAELMRIKLGFAFGQIRAPEELVEALPLEAEPVTLGRGVILRRLAPNRFQFTYGDESVEVDLNLGPDEAYVPPYPLGAHAIRREYFGVVHSGDGDGWDTERPTMGSILMFQGRIYLIDAGPHIDASLMALGISLGEVDGIFHTHCHDDHFCGLATLLRSDRRIKYFATPLVRHSMMKKLAALIGIHEDPLEDYFDFHDLAFDEWNDVDGLEVMPLYSPHSVETNLFMFRALWADGHRTYAHYADIASVEVLRRMVSNGDGPGIGALRLDKVLADYRLPADVKKLDIGGGLIHGEVRDFLADRSKKLILAHTARPLTNEERAVGSGAPFGTVDVLIPATQDYAWRYALDYLRTYFPAVTGPQLAMLLNSPKLAFNPETILIREGLTSDFIYLVLTGNVEVINPTTNVRNLLSAGALLGELTGLHGLPAMETCRTASFVETLRFPCDLYLEFVKRNDLFGGISQLLEYREFLSGTRLCGEVSATTSLNRIAAAMKPVSLAAGVELDEELLEEVCFLRSGRIARLVEERLVETVMPGDFIGEDSAVYWTTYGHRLRTTEPTELYAVAPDVLNSIPGVRWKLLEAFQRRQMLV